MDTKEGEAGLVVTEITGAEIILEEPLHIQMALQIMSAYDQDLFKHSVRVAHYTCKIQEALGATRGQIELARISSFLHDLGKVAIPREILYKPSALSEHEFAQIKRHPAIGAQILQRMEGFAGVWPNVKHHHERWDGRGYPSGLSGYDIPLIARIIAVADAFEAMTVGRVYKPSIPVSEAIEELKKGAGSQFDPHVVEAFVNVLKRSFYICKA